MLSISSLLGIAGPAPYLVIVRKADYVPKIIAYYAVFSKVYSPFNSSSPTAKAPVNASPAPVVSTTARPS